MKGTSLLAMAAALASGAQSHQFYELPKTTEAPTRKKSKASHKQQARKAKKLGR